GELEQGRGAAEQVVGGVAGRLPLVAVGGGVVADVDQRCPADLVLEDGVGPRVGEQGPVERAGDGDVGGAGRAHRPDRRRVLGVEDGGEAGQAAFDELFVDDVGLVEAALGPGGGGVVDLDHERRPVGRRPGDAGERRRAGGVGGGGPGRRRRLSGEQRHEQGGEGGDGPG